MAIYDVYSVYTSPEGAPAPVMIQRWMSIPGKKPKRIGELVFAATYDLAVDAIPKGLTFKPPMKGDPANLLGTWETPE